MAEAASWYVEHAVIPEQAVEGKRLGRVVRHDSRNRLYPHQRQDRALTSQLHTRHIPILNQGNIGSCTGNMAVGAVGTDKLFGALPPSPPMLDEPLAVRVYSGAEDIDGDGPFPPNDNGSTGPSACQVLKNMGLISGYTHGFSLADVLDALEDGPVGIGSNWYGSMDSPDSSGLVKVSAGAQVRGGHEYLCRGKDVDTRLVYLDNSWGTDWGNKGSFSMSWDTLDRLLHEQGDGTVPIPLSQPAPTPVPVPPQPAPHPGPDDADLTLFRQVRPWLSRHHVGETRAVANDLTQWITAKGLR